MMGEERITYKKWLSRTFWLATAWTAMVGMGLIINAVMKTDGNWLVTLITAAGVIVGAYIGLEKAKDLKMRNAQ